MVRDYFKIQIVMVFVVSLWLGSDVASVQAKTPVANAQCPVMKGERAKEKFFVDYKGEHILFCCKSCIKRFNKNPEKYLARLRSQK